MVALGGLARPPFRNARAEKAEACLVQCAARNARPRPLSPRPGGRRPGRCGVGGREHHENATQRETCEHVAPREPSFAKIMPSSRHTRQRTHTALHRPVHAYARTASRLAHLRGRLWAPRPSPPAGHGLLDLGARDANLDLRLAVGALCVQRRLEQHARGARHRPVARELGE
eukprot:scaffold95919_cov55-Phaeocystis_antarctica.AAC.2